MKKKVGDLLIGWAVRDITPTKTVALLGQFEDRFSTGVLDPLSVTALAMETVDDIGHSIGQSVMVSCDTCMIPAPVQEAVRLRMAGRLAGLDSRCIFLTATHIHTGPYLERCSFINPKEVVFAWPDYNPAAITPEEYADYMVSRVCDAVDAAWKWRKKGNLSWQLGHAAVGHSRRVVYDDGTALMYGGSDTIHYRGPEGAEDSGVELLYTWDEQDQLTGVVVNVACPSQVIEHTSVISADYWGVLRQKVKDTYGKHVAVFGMCGAAGDQSPRDLARRGRGETSMYTTEGMAELADNLLNTIQFKYPSAQQSKVSRLVLQHEVKTLPLPYRNVSKSVYAREKARYDTLLQKYQLDKQPIDKEKMPFEDLVALYEAEGTLYRAWQIEQSPVYPVEAHFIRIGDIAVATNPFELYTVYGLMIKARAKAQQTFIAQLSCDHGGYLATQKAVKGGHYSTTIAAGNVGPEGGQMLVEYSVASINELWDD